MKRIALLAPVCLMLAGCSQVAAIAPVGGSHEAEVRYAAIDMLVDAGTEILVAPVCDTDADGTVSCTGETVSGDPISVASPASDQTVVKVTVGSDVIYSGSIMDVIDRAARAGS